MADTIIFHGISIEPEFTFQRSPTIDFYGISITTPNILYHSAPPIDSTSKKVYLTNKGNIMINPNDTILIEI
jgi:hypothetical protein